MTMSQLLSEARDAGAASDDLPARLTLLRVEILLHRTASLRDGWIRAATGASGTPPLSPVGKFSAKGTMGA
jgi:hypothetical protein